MFPIASLSAFIAARISMRNPHVAQPQLLTERGPSSNTCNFLFRAPRCFGVSAKTLYRTPQRFIRLREYHGCIAVCIALDENTRANTMCLQRFLNHGAK